MQRASGRPLKITVVGDGTVGKTCMLVSYTTQKFPTDYVPTVFDNYAGSLDVDGSHYNITLWDTAGQEEYERLRPLAYPNTDAFLLCYAVDTEASYQNIINKWRPEIRHHCPHTPIVLVATKIDKRTVNGGAHLIDTVKGRKLKSRIQATSFVECSALTGENLSKVFEEAVRAAIAPYNPKPRCNIL